MGDPRLSLYRRFLFSGRSGTIANKFFFCHPLKFVLPLLSYITFVQRQLVVNRAPVLTLWAAVVAEVLGFEHDEVLTLGRAVAELNAYSKGVSLGLFQPTPKEVQEQRRKMRKEETVTIDLLHRAVPAKHTDEGLRALSGESHIRPESVEKYLEGKFGDALEDVSRNL